MRITWSENAKDDIRTLSAYIRAHNPSAAAQVVEQIFAVVRNLRALPHLGTAVAGKGHHRRVLIPKTPYFVIYRIVGEEIQIAYVHHTSRAHY
ncbi:type II toxin-antitoxin system RelE/ParE family toxin [Endothiovibrio diazotrophicus]